MNWRVERAGVVDSTNNLVAQRVRESLARGEPAPEGLVIVAEGQRMGRGQHGRKWESPPGGLYLSAVVGGVPVELRDRLALFAGAVVAEAIEQVMGKPVRVRWPNDVMIEGRKVAGVLCESVVMGAAWVGIVGVGVNVGTDIAKLPMEVRDKAGRLGAGVELRAVEEALLERLGAMMEGLGGGASLAEFVAKVRQRDELLGKSLGLQTSDGEVSGIGAGIGDGGELLIRDTEGTRAFARGTVVWVDLEHGRNA